MKEAELYEVSDPTPLEDWINTDVATDMLGISTRSLQNLRSSGVLPFAKLCGKCYYKRSDLEKLLESKYGYANADYSKR